MKAIKPPIEYEAGREIAIPKLLFPFNETYLKFALFVELKSSGIEAYLEPTISHREKRPDILLPTYRKIVEAENFWKCDICHALSYERETGLDAYTATWLKMGLEEELRWKWRYHDRINLISVNPATGEIAAPEDFYRPSPPSPVDVNYIYGLPRPNTSAHAVMEYELFSWLERQGYRVASEIKYRYGQVYVPDEVVISRSRGIVNYSPEKFAAYARVRLPPSIVDVVAMHPTTCAIKGHELKTRKELSDENGVLNLIAEGIRIVRYGLLNEPWLVLPEDLALILRNAKEVETRVEAPRHTCSCWR